MNKSCSNPTLGLLLLLLLLFFSTPLLALEDYILPSGEWRQISLPLDPGTTNNTVSAIFEDDIKAVKADAVYEADWIIFAYDSAAGGYDRKDLGDVLQQGVGYWITQVTGSTATLAMPEDSVAGPNPFSITVVAPENGGSTRWNMLGHPLEVPVKFSDYRIKTSSGGCKGQGCAPSSVDQKSVHSEIWWYKEGAYQKASGDDELNPWDGFWCAALTGSANTSPQLFVASTEHHPPIAGKWSSSPTFEEEFVGNSLSPDRWRIGGHYLGIAGKAANAADQITVQEGKLMLTAKKVPFTFAGQSYDYVSGEISTFQQFKQPYGYFEARIKYDAKQGAWPAFWTMPDRGDPATDDYGNKNLAHESFIRFDLGGISQPVESAQLKVRVTALDLKEYSNLVNVTVHKLLSNTNWDEQAITWDNKPAYDPAWLRQFTWENSITSAPQIAGVNASQEDLGFSPTKYQQAQLDSNKGSLYPPDSSQQGISSAAESANSEEITVGQELVIDVTGYINSQIADNQNTVGFALVDTFMRINKIIFGSKEASLADDQPRLVIDDSTLNPAADAYVRAGSHSNENYGEEQDLMVQDPWKMTSSTKNTDVHNSGLGMEIDVMESLGSWAGDTQHAVHWNGYDKNNGYERRESEHVTPITSSDGYHTYGMSWQPGRIDFYIDGIKSGWEFVDARTGSIDSYILLSHQLGGWEAENKLDSFQSATMLVDHVRVWSGSPSP